MFMIFLAGSPENTKVSDSSSDNSPIVVGGAVGVCVVVVIGVSFAVFVIRYIPIIVNTFIIRHLFEWRYTSNLCNY